MAASTDNIFKGFQSSVNFLFLTKKSLKELNKYSADLTFKKDSGIIKAVQQINRELETNYTVGTSAGTGANADDDADANGGVRAVADVGDGGVGPLGRLLVRLVREHDDVVRLLDAAGRVVLVLLGKLSLLALLRGGGHDCPAKGTGAAAGGLRTGRSGGGSSVASG